MVHRRSYLDIIYGYLKVGRIILRPVAHPNIDIGLLYARVKRHPDCLILELDCLIYSVPLIIQTVEEGKLETRQGR